MLTNRHIIPFLLGASLLTGGLLGCKKYAELPKLSSPAYLRVFNSIATSPNVLHTGQVTPFLTFLMDPVLGKDGIPQNAAVIGDKLATRLLYTVSYPYDEANITPPPGTPNYEYPGRSHVLAAPAINGLDLSAWAQIPAGTHRVMFVVRPQLDTPFTALSENQRSDILIDTTLNFQQGEVYTVEAVLRNADLDTYGTYVRQEDFIHQSFSPDSIYLSLYNLSTPEPQNALSALSQYYNWIADTLTMSATYYAFDYTSGGFDTIPGAAKLNVQYGAHFSTQPNYFALPFLDSSYFYDPQHNIGTYDTQDPPACCGEYAAGGTLPFLAIQVPEYGGNNFSVAFGASPDNFNNLYPPGLQFSGNRAYSYPFQASEELPNLNLIIGAGATNSIYPTINILEVVDDRVYLMQIQKGLNQLP